MAEHCSRTNESGRKKDKNVSFQSTKKVYGQIVGLRVGWVSASFCCDFDEVNCISNVKIHLLV